MKVVSVEKLVVELGDDDLIYPHEKDFGFSQVYVRNDKGDIYVIDRGRRLFINSKDDLKGEVTLSKYWGDLSGFEADRWIRYKELRETKPKTNLGYDPFFTNL